MKLTSFFFDESNFIPYVSFVINRPRFTKWKVKSRTIEDHELVLIAGGNGVLRHENTVFPLETGTLIYLHYDQWHSMEANRESYLNFYSVHFSWMLASHTQESWTYHKNINYYLKNEPQSGNNWSVTVNPGLMPFPSTMKMNNYDTVLNIYSKMNDTYHKKKVGYNMKLSLLCQELVYELCKERFFPADRTINVERLEKVLNYIDQNFVERITTEDLCEQISLSTSNLIKLFKKNLGLTPIGYINKVRVNRAKELLLHSQRSVKEIAYETGFSDEFYFSRVFKKVEGQSPRDFKNKMLS